MSRFALLSPERKRNSNQFNRKQNDILVVVHRLFRRLRFIGFMVETACFHLLVIVLATLVQTHGAFVFLNG
jgi:hypothetical protein